MKDTDQLTRLETPSRANSGLFSSIKSSFQTWPQWWSQLSWFQKTTPAVVIFLYWGVIYYLHGLVKDHLVVGSALLFLYYCGKIGRDFLKFGIPFFLTLIIYDSQRYYADYIRGPIHVTQPYYFDKYFFGIPTQQGVLTPNEWWQNHLHPTLDLIAGFAYLVFFSVFILTAGYFAYFAAKRGRSKLPPERIHGIAMQMPWAFFWLNMIGYSTYYWYAAAPPWYVTLYGLGPARMDVPANSAGCARFDQILGTHFFSEMYGRAADVFGAIPSLHVAYPLLAVYFAFHLKSARIFSICFYLLMCFSAVYLNHHYMLDILWGSAYALLVGWITMRVYEYRNP